MRTKVIVVDALINSLAKKDEFLFISKYERIKNRRNDYLINNVIRQVWRKQLLKQTKCSATLDCTPSVHGTSFFLAKTWMGTCPACPPTSAVPVLKPFLPSQGRHSTDSTAGKALKTRMALIQKGKF